MYVYIIYIIYIYIYIYIYQHPSEGLITIALGIVMEFR